MFNAKITMMFSTSQVIFLHLPACGYSNDYEFHRREEWDAITLNYSCQHIWRRLVASSRWLNGESSGIMIGRFIEGSGSKSGRKIRHNVKRKFVSRICRQGMAVIVLAGYG